MAFTASDLAALEAAYAAGILEITAASGKKLKYASMSDLWAAILRLRAELAPASRRHQSGVMRWSNGRN